jgi:hypothetical protein
MTFPQDARWPEISRFLAVSLADNGFFLPRFFGIAPCQRAFSASLEAAVDNSFRFRVQMNSSRLEQPEVVPAARMRRVDLSTTSWVFNVCRFFLPE